MPDITTGRDNDIRKTGSTSSWAAVRDAITGNGGPYNSSTGYVQLRKTSTLFYVRRGFFAYDTSGITVAPDSATFNVYGYRWSTADLIICKVEAAATGDSSTDFVAGDFGKIDFSTTYSAEVASWNIGSPGTVNTISFNAAALSDMTSLDEFKFVLIEHDHDYSDNAPTTTSNLTSGFYTLNHSTSGYRPFVSYVEATGYGNTVNAVASANIAAVNSVLTANISKINGV